MKVYRVEHWKYSEGPYMNGLGEWQSYSTKPHNADYGRPGPENDGLGYLDSMWLYGFESLGQLKRWFEKGERVGLHEEGFVVRVYDVPKAHVKRGKKQVVFEEYAPRETVATYTFCPKTGDIEVRS